MVLLIVEDAFATILGRAVLVALSIPALRTDMVPLVTKDVVNAVVKAVVVVSNFGIRVTVSTVAFATFVSTPRVMLPTAAGEDFDMFEHISLICTTGPRHASSMYARREPMARPVV